MAVYITLASKPQLELKASEDYLSFCTLVASAGSLGFLGVGRAGFGWGFKVSHFGCRAFSKSKLPVPCILNTEYSGGVLTLMQRASHIPKSLKHEPHSQSKTSWI